jgi:hypothetical protein
MRKLASNERRLLVVFFAAVFVAANLFVIRFWIDKRRDTLRATAANKAKLAEYTSLVSAAEMIESASAWIAANPPPALSADEANTRLLGEVRAFAEKAGLSIVEESLLPVAAGAGKSAALQTKVAGPFAGFAAFLFGLQRPEAWRSIDRIAIRSDKEPPNVIAEIVVRQHYNDGGDNP